MGVRDRDGERRKKKCERDRDRDGRNEGKKGLFAERRQEVGDEAGGRDRERERMATEDTEEASWESSHLTSRKNPAGEILSLLVKA